MEEKIENELIAKIVSNEASTEEKEHFNLLMQTDSAFRKKYLESHYIWEYSTEENVDTDIAWERFRSKAFDEAKSKHGHFRLRTFAAAACLILLSGIGLFGLYRYFTAPITVYTAANETKAIRMSDGTEVMLFANSSFTYPRALIRDKREVTLTGTAFFDVAHNPAKPFIIATPHAVTRVLGTSFLVRCASGFDEVHVKSGKVQFAHTDGGQVILTQGMSAITKEKEGVVLVAQHSNSFSLQTKRLIFDDQNLAYVLPVLESYFGVSIEVSDPRLLQCMFTGEFIEPSLQQVLLVMQRALNVSVSHVGDTITVSGEGCK